MPRNPSGFDHLLNPEPTYMSSGNSRLRLFVRQQPGMARTCAAREKNRRCIDPSPIVQLLINNFDRESHDDIELLKEKHYVVSCHLFPVPDKTEGQAPAGTMYGKTYVSPFFVGADPEPARAPAHPGMVNRGNLAPMPGTFFVFADLRVPFSGSYRLRFRLMNVSQPGPTGQIPILNEVWSNPFTAYSAKNFPGMSPTPYLSEELKRLGADGSKSNKAKGYSGGSE